MKTGIKTVISDIRGSRKEMGNWLFYLALTIELVLMIVEKSEIPFGFESHVFRITFVLTLLAVLIMEHSSKEWIVILVLLAFTFLCYRISGKNDLLRVAVFMMSAKNIDLRKAIKYSFILCTAGFALIALLSVTGILGDIARVGDYGRGIMNEKRYVFGFGHPNTLFSSIYVLVLMWLWLYGADSGVFTYAVIVVASSLSVVMTRSRTGAAILAVTILAAAVCRLFPRLASRKILYILSALISPVLCVATAVIAAGLSSYMYTGKGIPVTGTTIWQLENKINYRLSSLYYDTEGRDGILTGWKLIAGRGSNSYFDMGWVRLFYWYGILPTVLISAAILALIYMCYRKKDIWMVIIIISISIYTVMEATFVTRYIGRDFFLIIAGVYLCEFCCRTERKDLTAEKVRDPAQPVNNSTA